MNDGQQLTTGNSKKGRPTSQDPDPATHTIEQATTAPGTTAANVRGTRRGSMSTH